MMALEELRAWKIVHAPGHSFIGEVDTTGTGDLLIRKALEVVTQTALDPNGRAMHMFVVRPVESIGALDVSIPRGVAMWIDLSRAPDSTMEVLLQRVNAALGHGGAPRGAPRIVMPGSQ